MFSTSNPLADDRISHPVRIIEIGYNETTRTIEAIGSDGRKRQCRIDRISNTEDLRQLTKELQAAYDNEEKIRFVAAGGNNPDIWFYKIQSESS